MERRQAIAKSIGAAIGALLGVVVSDYLLAFEPGGISVDAVAGYVTILLGAAMGAAIGGILTSLRGDAR